MSPLRIPFVLALAIAVLFFLFLGAHPYLTPSEARYIEIPRQMVISGDWVVPHLNGVPYFEKPPLFYWMQAGVFSLFGWGEYAGRALTALFSVALCLLTYALGRMLVSERAGIGAALALATCWLGFALSRVAMLDVPLTLFITATLACFLASLRTPRAGSIYGMYVFAALAVLTKGLIGAVLPGMIVFVWLCCTGRWSVLKRMRLVSGTLLFLLIAAPWHIAAGMRYPQFWNFYFIHEHFSRFATEVHHRDQPWWFFLAVTIAGLMPWTPLLYRSIPHTKRLLPQQDYWFLLLWVLLPLCFFSLSHSKLIPYILPIFPPLCVFLGGFLADAWNGTYPRLIRGVTMGLCLALLTAGLSWEGLTELPGLLPWCDETCRALPVRSIMLTGGGLCLLPIALRHTRMALIVLAALTPLLGYWLQSFAADLAHGSMKTVAATLQQNLQPGDEVVLFQTYRQDLPVYLNRNITVVDYKGELAFGTEIEPKTHSWMIDMPAFWQACAEKPLYVLMTREAFAQLDAPASCRLHQVSREASADERALLLLTNKEPVR